MPSYITHAIFGRELHQKFNNVNKNILIDKNYMTKYALGPDLSRFTNSYEATHMVKTREFLLMMIWYIKENKLINNPQALGKLFGHISHYFLDINIHPLVYYNALGCETVGMISPHTLIESYLDEYFREEKKLNDVRLLKDFKVNEEDSKVISETYDLIYKEGKIISSMRKSLIILANLELLAMKLPKELLVKIARFNEFLDVNALTKEEILNSNYGEWLNPMTGKSCYKSMNEMYIDALNQTLEAMVIISNYFDNKVDISNVEKLFQGLSYNTGIDWKLGQDMKYIRKRVK